MEIPSADDLLIFYQIALIVHSDKKAKKLTGTTVFADGKQGSISDPASAYVPVFFYTCVYKYTY